jgi:ribosomal protein S18 acetylase RimI-like enzyme
MERYRLPLSEAAMEIRQATLNDLAGIKYLTGSLGYPGIETLTRKRMNLMLADPDCALLVFLKAGTVGGFMSLRFVPGEGSRIHLAVIGYFAIDPYIRSRAIGKELEEYACLMAGERRAESIAVRLPPPQTRANTFYREQGCGPTPDFFIKELTEKP